MHESYSGKFFFVSSTRSVHFFQHHQLELWTSKTYSKPQNKNIDVQNLENRIPLWCSSLGFFSTLCDFLLKFFGFHQRVSPSFVSIFCNTMDVKKSQRVPFTFFGTVTPFKNLILKIFFRKFFKISQGSPFNFFHTIQPTGVSQSPKGPSFTILSLRYSADFGRSRLVKS